MCQFSGTYYLVSFVCQKERKETWLIMPRRPWQLYQTKLFARILEIYKGKFKMAFCLYDSSLFKVKWLKYIGILLFPFHVFLSLWDARQRSHCDCTSHCLVTGSCCIVECVLMRSVMQTAVFECGISEKWKDQLSTGCTDLMNWWKFRRPVKLWNGYCSPNGFIMHVVLEFDCF